MKIERTETGKYLVDISEISQQIVDAENVYEARDKMLLLLTNLMNDYIEEDLG